MSKFDAKKVMPRYRAISFGLIFFAVLVVGKSLYIMTGQARLLDEGSQQTEEVLGDR